MLAGNDPLALGGIRWCRHDGVEILGDLAIVGYDNISYGEFAVPPLSTVDYPAEEVARRAVARLLTLIGCQGPPPEPGIVHIPPALIFRESSQAANVARPADLLAARS